MKNFIQIGTCIGNDDFINRLPEESFKLILVEPMSVHNKKISDKYKDIKHEIENLVIVEDDNIKDINFYYHLNDGPKYEVASIDKNHILKHGYSTIDLIEIKVPCITINNLFEKHKIDDVEFLWIDAEGQDEKIIKSINFTKYKIKNILFETLHIDTQSTINFLIEKGYSITNRVGLNGWDCIATLKN